MKNFFPFYALLTRDEKETLNRNLQNVTREAGQFLGEQGNGNLGMFLVRSGRVSVSLLSEEGKEITLFDLDDGEVCFLSATEAVRELTFDITVEAVTRVEASLLPAATLSALMKSNPKFSLYVYQHLVSNFSDAVWMFERILFSNVEKRLASFLWEESARIRSPELCLTHEQIAKRTGCAREVVSRTLKRFSEQGIVSVERGKVTVLSKDALKKLV